MNWKKIFTIAALTGFSASVATGQGTATTILEGSYISNVFGQSNFIKNPNAKLNTKDVTTVTATVTRSTTTPLVATSEFTVAIGTANGTATWATRAFDAGMKGQNCEARFTYRGFAATSKVHIKQGANNVATLNLTPATDPRIASINFPCGDLSAATTFVVTDTAILAGTNEISGIYTGLATNMANVAQAEFVGATELASCNTAHTVTSTTFANLSSPTCTRNNFGAATTSTNDFSVTIPNAKPGWYFVKWNGVPYVDAGSNNSCYWALKEDTQGYIGGATYAQSPTGLAAAIGASQLTMDLNTTTTATRTFRVVGKSATGSCKVDAGSVINSTVISVFRFPTSSELVVTPERQNTYGGAQWTSAATFNRSNTTEITMSSANFATNRSLLGKAQFTGTANDVAITIPSMPPGSYKVELAGRRFSAQKTAAGTTDFGCTFTIKDGTNSTNIAVAQYGVQYSVNSMPIATAVFTYSSLADRTFTAYLNGNDTNSVDCVVDQPKIIITPLDQPSNSALYVQGPVLAAATGAAIPASYVGQEIRSSVTSFTNFPTSSTYGDCTSITLTAGVWDISALAVTTGGSGVTSFLFGIGTASGSSSAGLTFGDTVIAIPVPSTGDSSGSIPQYRVAISSSTLYYAKVRSTYSTVPQYTCRISATRVN